MYVPLDFRPGFVANGTLYQNKNVWYDGDKVRWHRGLLQPIGGWERLQAENGVPIDQLFVTPDTNKARALHAWKSNSGVTFYAVGYNSGLVVFNRGQQNVYNITPVGFVARASGQLVEDGYGEWYYNTGTYGTPRPYDEQTQPVFNWCLRNFGEYLLASERHAPSALYSWDANFANIAVKVANAPENFDCFHVTEQRIIMTAGSSDDPRLIQWSDVEDMNDWTPLDSNQAGFQRLSGNGRFQEILDFKDLILLISETDLYVAQYIRPPYIFGFNRVGDNCGAVAGEAVASTEDFVVWMGMNDFFFYDGNLRRLDCPVMDRVIDTISQGDAGKTVSFVNDKWSEVWWLYESNESASGDLDRYVAWNYKENSWVTGTIDRTVGGAHSMLYGPIMIGNDGYVYRHELINVIPGEASDVYVETGPIQVAKHDAQQYADYFLPDAEGSGQFDLTIYGQDRPTGPEIQFGPYRVNYEATKNQPIPIRARGFTMRLRIDGVDGLWAFGQSKLNMMAEGRK